MLEDLWLEPTLTDGYGLRLLSSTNFQIRGHFAHTGTWGKVQTLGSSGVIEYANTDGEDIPWTSIFDVDAPSTTTTGSNIVFEKVYSRRSDAPFPIDKATAMKVRTHLPRSYASSPLAGIVPAWSARFVPTGNLLANASFEGGALGWSGWGAAGTPLNGTVTFPQSEVGPGAMLNATSMTGATQAIWARVAVPAGWAGRLMTFSILAKITGNGFITPYVSGAGINPGYENLNRIDSAAGWQLLSTTVQPTGAGNLDVGVWVKSHDGSSVVNLDEARVSLGDEGQPGGDHFQYLDLGTATIAPGTAAPVAGTWRAGSVILNSAPTAGAPFGWRNVAAGSPGTWEPMYVHSTAP